jgi:hypothetical protein
VKRLVAIGCITAQNIDVVDLWSVDFVCNFLSGVEFIPTGGTGMPKHALSLNTCLFVVVGFAAISQRAAAQTLPIHVQEPLPGHPGTVARSPQPPPCWEVAGISKSAMGQRRAIQQRTRSEVEAVCADPSLSPQQRQQKIRQIHEQDKQELDALVSPQQMEALKSCQMSRNRGTGHPGGGHPASGGGHGPCGEMPARSGSNPPSGGKPEAEPQD